MSEVAPQQPFVARSALRNGVARIAVEGELDLGSVPQFSQSLARVDAEADGQGPPHVLLDLRGLTFMDSSGLREVLAAATGRSERGRQFAIIGVGGPVRRLFEVTGTGRFIDGADALGLIQRFTGSQSEGDAP